MAGISLLTRCQIGKETTSGTAVASTSILRFENGFLDDQREVVHVPENVGYLSKVNRTNTPKLLGNLNMSGTATFEQICYVLESSIKTVSAESDGIGSGKIRTYPAETTAANTIATYTLEGGDNQQAYEMEYAFAKSWTLSGAGGNSLQLSADWYGRQVQKTTFTAGLSLPSVDEINFGEGKLFIDSVSGTMGTTQINNTWLDFSLKYNSGFQEQFTGTGQKYFSHIEHTGPEITLDLTLEHDTNSVSLFDAFQEETPYQVRMLFEGPALTTAGTTYSKKTLRIDLVGKVEKWGTPKNDNGVNTIPVTLRCAYDGTCAKFFEMVVVNQLATLP